MTTERPPDEDPVPPPPPDDDEEGVKDLEDPEPAGPEPKAHAD